MNKTHIENIANKFTRLDSRQHTLLPPLTVSKSKKILYFHIAKTGGSSIVKLLKNNQLDDGILSNKTLDIERKKEYFKEVVEDWENYYKFTFIRNKFDLLISLYNYDLTICNGQYSLDKHVTFEEFIKEHVGINQELYTSRIDQYYLTHTDGKCMFDFMGRFENYAADLTTVCDHIGIHNTEERVNTGNYDRTKKSGYYTPELEQLVKEKFPQEIKHFNFSFQDERG
jgi:hypothetical protein